MTIETKYEIGARVWLMAGNKPIEAVIYAMEIAVHQGSGGCAPNIGISYLLSSTGASLPRVTHEFSIFPDKQSLLLSL